jgi:long-chain acyl-CoA synthetase
MIKKVIPVVFRETAKKFAAKNSLGKKYPGSEKFTFITFQELEQNVAYFASALLELGIKPGDKIALMSENSPEWVITDLGVISLGAWDVPVYPSITHLQLEYILNDCGVKGIMVSNDIHYQKVVKLFDKVPGLEFIIYVEPVTVVAHPGVKSYSFEEISEIGKNSYEKNKQAILTGIDNLKSEDICTIIYTSGTTGQPKGVMLSHRNCLESVEVNLKAFSASENEVELSFLPLCHIFERVVYYLAIVCTGGSVAYAENIDSIAKNMLEVRPTLIVSVPRIYEKIYNRVMDGVKSSPPWRQKIFNWALRTGKEYFEAKRYEKNSPLLLEIEYKIAGKLVFNKIKDKTGGNIRVMLSGGAPLAKEIVDFFAWTGMPIYEGYGLTEAPGVSFNMPGNFKPGTIGKPLPGVDIKIAEDGEILARGPNIMKGYYNNQVATAEAIDPDGWFHTGDIGELDNENYLKITDRKKEIIVMSNGKNVAPQPVENLLKASKYIEQAVIIGDNRKFISALLVPNFENLGSKAKELGIEAIEREALCKNAKIKDFYQAEINKACGDKIAPFEQVKKFSLLNCEFSQNNDELTPTLKVKRRIIDKIYKDLIESMYESAAISPQS